MHNLVHTCFSSRRGDMSWLYCNFAFRKKGLGGGGVWSRPRQSKTKNEETEEGSQDEEGNESG